MGKTWRTNVAYWIMRMFTWERVNRDSSFKGGEVRSERVLVKEIKGQVTTGWAGWRDREERVWRISDEDWTRGEQNDEDWTRGEQNNNNVHLSRAHPRPERSHNTY